MNKEILNILISRKSIKELPAVFDALKKFDENELFSSLFYLSIQEQEIGKGVAFAAYSLYELNPKAQIEVNVAVEMLLKHWDISLEEVVFYLAKQFGNDIVRKEASRLISTLEVQDEITRAKADAQKSRAA
jgi:hypothetical protein